MLNKLENLSIEAQRQRQAIYIGLTSVLSPQQASMALESWATYFNGTGSVFSGLNAFARDICDSFSIPGQQRDLVKALNRALLSKDSVTGTPKATANPSVKIKAVLPAVNGEAANGSLLVTPEFQTFQYLITELLRLVETKRGDLKSKAVLFLSEVVESMPWSEAQQQQMSTLLATGNTVQTRAYRADQLKSFLKHFLTWMADEVGTATAEKFLKESLQNTERSAFGSKYKPDNFV